jgi:transposase
MNKTMTIGLDLAKNSFALVKLDGEGQEQLRRTFTRHRLLAFMSQQEPTVVALEACAGAHYWAREIAALGHPVVVLPPQHVKGYQRGQKNDYNDALAIAEACQHNRLYPVRVKTLAEQEEHCFHTLRRSLTREKTRLSNPLRGLLGEFGVVMAKGDGALHNTLTQQLSDQGSRLPPGVRVLLGRQYDRFRAVVDELAWYDAALRRQAAQDDTCQRLQAVPGMGPVVASVVKQWMGNGQQFACGRDASAAMGLVPRQHSSGGKDRLGSITKRGDAQVRATVIHGARAVVRRSAGKTDPLSLWIESIKARRGFNKAVVALANKLIRIAWVIIARGEHYMPRQALPGKAA